MNVTVVDNSPCDILLVEDNSADVEMVTEWINERKHPLNLSFATDGKTALTLLSHYYEIGHLPSLILLDINLPGMPGMEVLQIIKSGLDLGKIPVVMLTSSEAGYDLNRCYELQANGYVMKNANLSDFYDSLDKIYGFWFKAASIPKSSRLL